MRQPETHHAWFIAYPGVQALDITGPADVLDAASAIARERGLPWRYQQGLLAASESALRTTSGLQLQPDYSFRRRPPLEGGTLFVPGGDQDGMAAVSADPALSALLEQAADERMRIASICTGAFILASTGLIRSGAITTHWSAADRLQREFPGLEVSAERIFCRQGRIYSSAGISSGIDLALHLVEMDLGRAVALEAAKAMVVPFRRSGGQPQYGELLSLQGADRRLEPLVQAVTSEPGRRLNVSAMADLCHMSERNFRRLVQDCFGEPPLSFLARIRTGMAANLIEQNTRLSLKQVAVRCGFSSESSMRRSFQRFLSCSPVEYRSNVQ